MKLIQGYQTLNVRQHVFEPPIFLQDTTFVQPFYPPLQTDICYFFHVYNTTIF